MEVMCPECYEEWEDVAPGWVRCLECQHIFEVDEEGIWVTEDEEADEESEDFSDEVAEAESSFEEDSPAHSQPMFSGNRHSVADFAPLMDAAKPEIYQDNAFRVLNLSVSASNREIVRQLDKFRLQQKRGANKPVQKVFPFDLSSGLDEIREAEQRLRDPKRRMVAELFWFWSLQGDANQPDEALLALSRGDIEVAYELWLGEENGINQNAVATHNLAVLSHLKALQAETSTSSLSPIQQRQRDSNWREAYKRWNSLLHNREFEAALQRRIRAINDPALPVEAARQIMSALPFALLTVNAQLITRATTTGDIADVKRQKEIMEDSGFAPKLIDEALRRAVIPLRESLHKLCKQAKMEGETNPVQADQTARRLLEQSGHFLQAIDLAVAEGDIFRDDLHDELATAIRSCLIEYGNETDDWEVCIELLRIARSIAVRQTLVEKLDKDLETCRNNLLSQDTAEVEGLLAAIKKILDLPMTTTMTKASRLRSDVLPVLENLKAKSGALSEDVFVVSNALAYAFRTLSVTLYRDYQNYESAYAEMQMASELCLDLELQEKIEEDLAAIQHTIESEKRSEQKKLLAERIEAQCREQERQRQREQGRHPTQHHTTFRYSTTGASQRRETTEKSSYIDVEPIKEIPSLGTICGIGTKLYGWSDYKTLYAVFFFLPLLPIGRYRVAKIFSNEYDFLGKTSLRHFEQKHRAAVLYLLKNWRAIAFAAFIVAVAFIMSQSRLSENTKNVNKSVSPQVPSLPASPPPVNKNAAPPEKQKTGKAHVNQVEPLDMIDMKQLPKLEEMPSRTVPATPPDLGGAIPPRQLESGASDYEVTQLKREIEAAENELEQLERGITALKNSIALFKKQIDYYDGIIKRIERDDRLGLPINQTQYDAAIKEHNDYVALHNRALGELREKIAAYNNLSDSTNTKIDRYNRLRGAR